MSRTLGSKAKKTIEAEAKILPLVSSLTIREIAETLDYPFLFVKNLCRRAGVCAKRHTYVLQAIPGEGTMAKKIVGALSKNNKSLREVANALGCSFQYVSAIKKRYMGGKN